MVFFWSHHRERERNSLFEEAWRTIVRDSLLYLAPVAPHLAEEGWRMTGGDVPMARQARFPEPRGSGARRFVGSEVS
jgi:leucyl-tRNA synthetase